MLHEPGGIGPRVVGPASSGPQRIDIDHDLAAAQLDQPVEPLAHAMRTPRADVIDLAGMAEECQGEEGPRHVADVDEVAAGVEVADGQLEWVRPGIVNSSANRPSACEPGCPGPTGLKTRATITSRGGPAASPAVVASSLLRP